jgi:hypothetical protein
MGIGIEEVENGMHRSAACGVLDRSLVESLKFR